VVKQWSNSGQPAQPPRQKGATALHVAAVQGQAGVVGALLEAGGGRLLAEVDEV
jgi:ankyrin repeat protein